MAFAPHTNSDVRNQLRAGFTADPRHRLPLVLGQFVETTHGHRFEYAERRHPDDSFAPECPHIIYVGQDGQYSMRTETRLAKVLKTVVYVVVDEAPDGSPVYEKWSIKGHSVYDTEWVWKEAV